MPMSPTHSSLTTNTHIAARPACDGEGTIVRKNVGVRQPMPPPSATAAGSDASARPEAVRSPDSESPSENLAPTQATATTSIPIKMGDDGEEQNIPIEMGGDDEEQNIPIVLGDDGSEDEDDDLPPPL